MICDTENGQVDLAVAHLIDLIQRDAEEALAPLSLDEQKHVMSAWRCCSDSPTAPGSSFRAQNALAIIRNAHDRAEAPAAVVEQAPPVSTLEALIGLGIGLALFLIVFFGIGMLYVN